MSGVWQVICSYQASILSRQNGRKAYWNNLRSPRWFGVDVSILNRLGGKRTERCLLNLAALSACSRCFMGSTLQICFPCSLWYPWGKAISGSISRAQTSSLVTGWLGHIQTWPYCSEWGYQWFLVSIDWGVFVCLFKSSILGTRITLNFFSFSHRWLWSKINVKPFIFIYVCSVGVKPEPCSCLASILPLSYPLRPKSEF